MVLLSGTGIEKVYGDRVILRGCDLEVRAGERIGLVGVNGSGKSTLLRILSGGEEPDHGEVSLQSSLVLLEQNPVLPGITVGDAADDALSWHHALLEAYKRSLEAGDMEEAGRIQLRLDEVGWEQQHRIDAMLNRLGAPPREARIAQLSGGESRRVALARALLRAPDVLILDEPTNHLDADTVEWLQGFLQGHRGAVLLVTHDRYLLEAVAERIVEVEDGKCVSYAGSYADYLLERAERQATLKRTEDRRLAMLAREAEWASRSPAARTGKQRARLKRLEVLSSHRALAVNRVMKLDLNTGIKAGRSVMEGVGLCKAYGERVLVDDVDFHVVAGDRIGILGPNGAGKTTLLEMLSGTSLPDRGEVRRAPRFRVALLDQGRTGLSDSDTVFEAAAGGNDHVQVGEGFVHVASFLRRFLFEREFLTQRVSSLSGGERARLLMARLLLTGCNLILLDEPTNDLDLQTLRVLEEALLVFDGAMVVVTHDRAFLDRVCNRIWAMNGDGQVIEYASRMQHVNARKELAVAEAQAARLESREKKAAKRQEMNSPEQAAKKRLSFNERRELDNLPEAIEAKEMEQAELETKLADPETYKGGQSDVVALSEQLARVSDEVIALYSRWETLSAREQ